MGFRGPKALKDKQETDSCLPMASGSVVTRQQAGRAASFCCDRMCEMETESSAIPPGSKVICHYGRGPMHTVAKTRSSAMALRELLPTLTGRENRRELLL